ncbi:class A beta-lactamase [Methylobacterium planeticum]|uniref:Beta-lactamase n=1 Tax=Methylobacterium planeticum TaxID=2615211 RepID=A0A6N6MMP5_9HYPH|nr:class A beta-lactamase [Methylobacterium planeticum]KAB1071630.1 class A beta-lactamase [Methylobacterium planeticum]
MLSRRGFALTILGAVEAWHASAQAADTSEALRRHFAEIEGRSASRLGVAVLDRRTGLRAGHRADERFPLCSTFKLLAAAAVLARVDAGRESLERRVVFSAADLVPYSPATERRVGADGMPLDEICAAAITLSDNTAGNLMLGAIDGPAGLTAYLRSLGDPVTRLDRTEPDLNEARPGDPRDTTSPAAMLDTLQRLLLGPALSAASRARLVGWLRDNETGETRLRARLPRDWRVGDKTGTGENGTANDVGILSPPGGDILVAAYLTESTAPSQARNATIAEVGQALLVLR